MGLDHPGFMKFTQVSKRILLFVVVNVLVVTTISVILGLLRVGDYFRRAVGGLAVFLPGLGFCRGIDLAGDFANDGEMVDGREGDTPT
jgi:hypothetical protein